MTTRSRLARLARHIEPTHVHARRTLVRLLTQVNDPSNQAQGTPSYEDVPRCDAADRLLPRAQAATDPRTIAEVWEQTVPEVLGWRPFGDDGPTWAAYCAGDVPDLIALVDSLGLDS